MLINNVKGRVILGGISNLYVAHMLQEKGKHISIIEKAKRMKTQLINLIHKHTSMAKFVIIGGSASVVHASISWVFYYQIWGGYTIFSTIMGYMGGWLVSYMGNGCGVSNLCIIP